jgi:hypothetical protein
MADQNRPVPPDQAPDPASSYGRENPSKEAGMGRLDNNTATPQNQPDDPQRAVSNRQSPQRQVNAQETGNARSAQQPGRQQPDHSMHDEEGLDEQYPKGIPDPREQRQPRTGGKGGTPDAGESRRNG